MLTSQHLPDFYEMDYPTLVKAVSSLQIYQELGHKYSRQAADEQVAGTSTQGKGAFSIARVGVDNMDVSGYLEDGFILQATTDDPKSSTKFKTRVKVSPTTGMSGKCSCGLDLPCRHMLALGLTFINIDIHRGLHHAQRALKEKQKGPEQLTLRLASRYLRSRGF